MRNKILAVSLFAASASFAAAASADVGLEFRVPFASPNKTQITNLAGYSTLLRFDIDETTYAGLLNENQTYTDSGNAGTKNVALQAIRFGKRTGNFSDNTSVYAGVDIGTITAPTTAQFSNSPVGDIFGQVKLLSSKGKITSYLSAEVLYRVAQVPVVTAGTSSDLGGLQFSIGAGIGF